ncbi:glycoside hydrolase family 2 TIM barrel-domain containing protein [Parabacteroides sp. FAFU027]|uniref:glycoside hydrolase family 2 TIM barrel-domain containing protein n=1 Tax=Parabacteroides sp. FAFU027 TaxID=2922715 RepID=UPI001FB00C7A|nr:glycoside hydrolase family 2 TIM barrel-domain containing protein [Parabacteroides sp. FAFU027]
MKLKKIITGICLLLTLLSSGSVMSQVLMPSRGLGKQISLNGIWKFKYFPSSHIGKDTAFFDTQTDVSRWADIRTPGHWELQGFAEPFYGKELKEGAGLYRTEFNVPADWKGEPIYIAFDGVQYGYQFWVNGKYAGSFNSSFNRQTFDISSFVTPRKANVLAVRVTTRSKGWEFDTNDCWSLSGIIRDVTLFSLPTTHIKDLVVRTKVGKTDATLSVSALIEKVSGGKFSSTATVTATLTDPEGKVVRAFSLTRSNLNAASDTASFFQNIKIDAPRLWTAETPNLYKLSVFLKDKGKEIQRYNEKVGIREITWDNGILKLNGKPIKLRGVNHHDLSPVNGRSVTEAEMLQDLKLIREANINYIRTSHYPPHSHFIELCDSLGFYVMEEVPFGFGDNHLNDKSYLTILKERAKSTIWRDKNHPSVIVWSVGNENPLTPMCIEVGEYVKQLDPTRPHCYPQIGSYFRKIYETIPASVDILSPHYTVPAVLREYSNKFDRPMIITEYAHALGLDFDRVEALWEIMYANPKLAGGSVWHFFDQGILRKSKEKTIPGTFTTSVWQDSVTVYDNCGNQGADGLVYANRVPQVDYWQLRKVYTPVKAMDDTLLVSGGKQTVNLKVNNRYDFTNLSQTRCKWALYADTTALESGKSALDCAPHDTMNLTINVNLPEKVDANYYYLKVQFSDKQNYTFYEKVYPLQVKNHTTGLRQKQASKAQKPVLKANTITGGDFKLGLNPQTGMIKLTDLSGSNLIANGPYARMGRKTTMSELATTSKPAEKKTANIDDPLMTEKNSAESNPVWTPHLLTRPQVKVESITAKKMVVNYTYERQNGKGQFISGKVIYSVSDSGRIDVEYRFVPNQAKGIALEAGLSFLMPASFTEFRWAGKGPYPAYPGKDRLDEFGLYHLNSADLNYQGNREDVDIAILSDAQGKGIALVANKSNIAVENTAEGIIVSYNAYVSGRFNKGSMPETKVNVEKLQEISGRFSIVPLNANWPDVLHKLFGSSTNLAKPFKPFYNSYDQ